MTSMTSFHNGTRTDQTYSPRTGELETGFFRQISQPPISSSSETNSEYTAIDLSIEEKEEHSSSLHDNQQHLEWFDINVLKQQIESLKNDIQQLREMLNTQVGDKVDSTLDGLTNLGEESESIEQWLGEWQKEEPEAVYTKEEIQNIVRHYEEKYQMTSEELLYHIQNGTAPDSYEIGDWKMLLEWI